MADKISNYDRGYRDGTVKMAMATSNVLSQTADEVEARFQNEGVRVVSVDRLLTAFRSEARRVKELAAQVDALGEEDDDGEAKT